MVKDNAHGKEDCCIDDLYKGAYTKDSVVDTLLEHEYHKRVTPIYST